MYATLIKIYYRHPRTTRSFITLVKNRNIKGKYMKSTCQSSRKNDPILHGIYLQAHATRENVKSQLRYMLESPSLGNLFQI